MPGEVETFHPVFICGKIEMKSFNSSGLQAGENRIHQQTSSCRGKKCTGGKQYKSETTVITQ